MNLQLLDIPTMITMLAAGNLVSAICMVVYGAAWAEDPSRSRFVLARLIQSTAWVLLRLRGMIPDLFSFQLGNTLLITGFSLETLALCVSVEPAKKRFFGRLFMATCALGCSVFLSMSGARSYGVAAASLAIIPSFAAIAFYMLSANKAGRLHKFIGLSYVFFVLIFCYRSIANFRDPTLRLMKSALVQTYTFAPVAFSLIANSIGITLLGRVRQDRLLRESEDKYRTLVERADEGIALVQNGQFLFANQRMASMLGKTAEELKGLPILGFALPDDRPMVIENFNNRMHGLAAPEVYEFRIVAPGGPRWISLTASRIQWIGQDAILGIVSDVDDKKRDMEKIRLLLRDKETLLSEVHHRVKNNLALVMSLLELQSGDSGVHSADDVIRDAKNRLRTMIDVYDRLGRRGEFRKLGTRDYLEGLVMDIASTYPWAGGIRLDFKLVDIDMDPNRLGTLGIIVNEAVTNSLKYAFRPLDASIAPRIFLSLEPIDGQRLRLTVGDNGRGMPVLSSGETSSGLGLSLIPMLAEQLKANMKTLTEGGVSYTLEFAL